MATGARSLSNTARSPTGGPSGRHRNAGAHAVPRERLGAETRSRAFTTGTPWSWPFRTPSRRTTRVSSDTRTPAPDRVSGRRVTAGPTCAARSRRRSTASSAPPTWLVHGCVVRGCPTRWWSAMTGPPWPSPTPTSSGCFSRGAPQACPRLLDRGATTQSPSTGSMTSKPPWQRSARPCGIPTSESPCSCTTAKPACTGGQGERGEAHPQQPDSHVARPS